MTNVPTDRQRELDEMIRFGIITPEEREEKRKQLRHLDVLNSIEEPIDEYRTKLMEWFWYADDAIERKELLAVAANDLEQLLHEVLHNLTALTIAEQDGAR